MFAFIRHARPPSMRHRPQSLVSNAAVGRASPSGLARAAALAVLASGAVGCATQPALEPGSEPPLSVAEARRALPEDARRVRWGGTIARVSNTAEGTSILEVVSRPLRRDGRPIRNDVTDGRFLAEIDGFLDPEIVKAGRDVTVTGQVTEQREGRIGELDYVYPVVAVDDYRYWKRRPTTPPYAHYPYPVPFGGYPYGIFGHGWPHHHYRGSGASVSGTLRF